MAEKKYIKHRYEIDGESLRSIAQSTGMSFRTVQKYAYEEDWNTKGVPAIEPERYPVLGAYIETIDEWLENDKREPRKQHHSMKRIFTRLQKEKDYKGSYTSVKKYVRKKKFLEKQTGEGFLPLAQPMAHAQVDFGKFKYYDGLGIGRGGFALTVSFPYSNMAFTQVFPSENQECLLEGMKCIFAHISGTPIRIRADNMTTAVAHVLKGTERELTDGFTRFMLQYRFTAEFCNPASGNEKGNVENKVGYSRRNFFVPVPTIEDFPSYNEELFKICEEDGSRLHYKHNALIKDLWEEERKHLLTLPAYEYHVFRYETARINNQGFIKVDTVNYGVSPEYYGKMAQVKIFFDKIEIYYDHVLLKICKRSYGRNDEVMDWREYLNVLCRKPGATTHTRFFDQMPKLWQEHLKITQGKERKTALMLLSEIVNDGNESLCDEAIAMATECGRNDTDSIRQCYYMISKSEYHPKPIVLPNVSLTLNYNPNLTVYDVLTGGVVNV